MSWKHRDAKKEAREFKRFAGVEFSDIEVTHYPEREKDNKEAALWTLNVVLSDGSIFTAVDSATARYVLSQGGQRQPDFKKTH